MKVEEIKGSMVYVSLENGKKIWLSKEMLRQYGINIEDLKTGTTLKV